MRKKRTIVVRAYAGEGVGGANGSMISSSKAGPRKAEGEGPGEALRGAVRLRAVAELESDVSTTIVLRDSQRGEKRGGREVREEIREERKAKRTEESTFGGPV